MNIQIETDLLLSFDLQCTGMAACSDLVLSIKDMNYGESTPVASATVLCALGGK